MQAIFIEVTMIITAKYKSQIKKALDSISNNFKSLKNNSQYYRLKKVIFCNKVYIREI